MTTRKKPAAAPIVESPEAQSPEKKAKTPRKPAAKVPQPARPMGRPDIYSEELAARVCELIAIGYSLRSIAKMEGMPVAATVFKWIRVHPEFMKQYEAAKQEQADAFAEDMIDIADDGTNDWMEVHDKDGFCVGYKINGEHVQRSRLRIDTRKWIAERMKPKKYGAKIDLEHGATDSLAELLSGVTGSLKARQQVDDDED